ncbi:MAG: hypothetical protein AAGB48_09435 [Planctomycetota bacterium]
MRSTPMHRYPIAAGLAVTASLAFAAPAASQAIADVRVAPISDITPAPKDEAAFRALMMLGDRLVLLPREIGQPEPNADQIGAFWSLITGGLGVQVELNEDELPALAITAIPNGGAGDAMALVDTILEESGERVRMMEDGSRVLETPAGGARIFQGRDQGAETMNLLLGRDEPASVRVDSSLLPEGVAPLLSAELGIGTLVSLGQRQLRQEDPRLHDILDEFGLFDAPEATFALVSGNAGDTLHTSIEIRNAGGWFDRMIGDARLDREALAVVPQDATYVQAAVTTLDWIVPIVEFAGEQAGRDFFAFLRDGFGLDLRAGVLENVGPTWIIYQSDTTGGGMALSTVLVLELRDADAFNQAQSAAMANANQLGATLGRGYARTRSWEHAGQTVQTLVTPGLPIPLEISWAVVGDSLVAAATPTALIGALGQMQAQTSVLDNQRFQDAVLRGWQSPDVSSIVYRDTARFADKGYGIASLVSSALANTVRKPFDDFTDPGVIMPSYADFVGGIQPTGFVGTWDGDNFVYRGTSDASFLVQTAAFAGAYGSNMALSLPGMSVGALLPALGQARASAQAIKGQTQVRAVVQAAIIWGQDNNGRGPESIDLLIDNGYITPEMLDSPSGPAWDGGGDIVLRTEFGEADLDSFRADLLVAMNRAEYVNGHDTTAMGFADGHTRAVNYWEAQEILDAPINAGLREAWDLD